jgi:exodeoxyribonuclease VII small subunit
MSFESDLSRLEAIVSELESDSLELDRALALFEEGIERLRSASGALGRADARVQLLIERSDGTFDLAAFRG